MAIEILRTRRLILEMYLPWPLPWIRILYIDAIWAGRGTGNSRNGARTKTVPTDVGEVTIDVPRDRGASFEPKIVAKRQKRLSGVEEMVISLSAKGLTTG